MPSLTLQLDEEDIRPFFDDGAWSRGRGYARYGHIVNGQVEGDTLVAECIGSLEHPYRVRATWFADQLDAYCTCPIGHHGDCKHVVALLMTWIEHPEDFVHVETLEALISEASADRLREALDGVIERYPQAAQLVEQILQGPEYWTAEQVRREVSRAMESWEPDEDAEDQLEWPVLLPQRVVTWANRIPECVVSGQFAAMVQILQGITDALRRHVHDYDSAVTECVEELVGTASGLLTFGPPEPLLSDLVERLVTIYRWPHGGYGGHLHAQARDALMANLDKNQRRRVAKELKDSVASPYGDGFFYLNRSYRHEGLLYYALVGAEDMTPQTRLGHARAFADPILGIDMMLELDYAKKPFELLSYATDKDVHEFLAPFERRGRLDEALDWMIAHEVGLAGYRPWLRDTLEKYSRWDTLIALSRRFVFGTTYGQVYIQGLRVAAQKAGRWEAERAEVVAQYGQRGNWDVVVSVYVDDEMWDEALDALDRVTEAQVVGSLSEYRRRIADQVAKVQPMAASLILAEDVEMLIARRNRPAYRQAAELLLQIRDYHRQADLLDRWEDYITNLRWDYVNLRALADELARAQL